MTIGISKETLEITYESLLKDYGSHPNDPGIKTCLEGLIDNCTELDPWMPIDEDTPKDGRLLNIGKWTGVNFEWIHAAFLIGDEWHLPFDSERDENGTPVLSQDEQPTHYKELSPEPPK